MAEYNYYNLQEDEVVINTPLQSGGRILYGSEAAEADVTTPTLLTSVVYPSSHPRTSQPSIGKKKTTSSTFKDGRLKLYAQPPNPLDPLEEKRRKKALESFNNRQASNLEYDVLQHTEMGLINQIENLEKEKTRLERNVQNLEMQQQNCQYQACENIRPIQGEHYSSYPPYFDSQQNQSSLFSSF